MKHWSKRSLNKIIRTPEIYFAIFLELNLILEASQSIFMSSNYFV
jgi:hypothetical protein